jgi:phosphatidylglycerophosphate synthase
MSAVREWAASRNSKLLEVCLLLYKLLNHLISFQTFQKKLAAKNKCFTINCDLYTKNDSCSQAVAVNNLGKWKTATQMISLTILLAARDSRSHLFFFHIVLAAIWSTWRLVSQNFFCHSLYLTISLFPCLFLSRAVLKDQGF